jgi:hypothetical protein
MLKSTSHIPIDAPAKGFSAGFIHEACPHKACFAMGVVFLSKKKQYQGPMQSHLSLVIGYSVLSSAMANDH